MPRGQMTISTPMSEAEVEALLTAMDRVLSAVISD